MTPPRRNVSAPSVVLALAISLTTTAPTGCMHPGPVIFPGARPYPGNLVPTSEIHPDFMVRQRVTATYPGGDASFEAVLQNVGGTLTLIGMTPFGTRGFVLQQRGITTTYTSSLPRDPPFPPAYILIDIHRVMFIGLPGAPLSDGVHTGERGGELIREVWASGRLMERHFTRLDGNPQGSIDVVYNGGMSGQEPPGTISFHNGWFGYSLRIAKLAYQVLPPSASTSTRGDGQADQR